MLRTLLFINFLILNGCCEDKSIHGDVAIIVTKSNFTIMMAEKTARGGIVPEMSPFMKKTSEKMFAEKPSCISALFTATSTAEIVKARNGKNFVFIENLFNERQASPEQVKRLTGYDILRYYERSELC